VGRPANDDIGDLDPIPAAASPPKSSRSAAAGDPAGGRPGNRSTTFAAPHPTRPDAAPFLFAR